MKRKTEEVEVILPAASSKVGNGQGVGLHSSGLRKNHFRIFPRRPYAASVWEIGPRKSCRIESALIASVERNFLSILKRLEP